MKIYSALFNDAAHLDKFGKMHVVTAPNELDESGILILHGGEDICPMLYKETPNSYSGADTHMSRRDILEKNLVYSAVDKGIPIFGICRGAQLLTALAGGSLVQHVNNHTRNHDIVTTNGFIYNVTSAHHQMCNPFKTDHQLLAWSLDKRSDVYLGEFDQKLDMQLEPEVIYYPALNALAVQPHPEWMPESDKFVQYLFTQIEEKLLCS